MNPLTPTEAVKAYRSAGVQAREAMIALTAARIAYADAETNYRACAFARDQAIADCRAALDPRGLPACA